MSEKDFRKEVVDGLSGPNSHVSCVESHETSAGIPDIDYCIHGVEGHVELKYSKKGGKQPRLRPTQKKWMRERIKAGGIPFLFVRFDAYGQEPMYCLIKGRTVLKFQGSIQLGDTLSNSCAVWHGNIDWTELREILKHQQVY